MLSGFRLAAIFILIAVVAYIAVSGCAMMGPKRAPLGSLSDTLDVETRTDMLLSFAEKYPKDPEVFYALGNVYYDQAIAGDARENYEKALALDPKMTKAQVNLAMLTAEAGEPDSAMMMLDAVVREHPRDSMALTDLGMIHANQKDLDAAVKYYTRAIAADPQNAEAHYNLGVAFANAGLLLEALREWRAVLDITSEGDTAQRAQLGIERVEGNLIK
jgi:tetratricopeptide (TPR) repeat protein